MWRCYVEHNVDMVSGTRCGNAMWNTLWECYVEHNVGVLSETWWGCQLEHCRGTECWQTVQCWDFVLQDSNLQVLMPIQNPTSCIVKQNASQPYTNARSHARTHTHTHTRLSKNFRTISVIYLMMSLRNFRHLSYGISSEYFGQTYVLKICVCISMVFQDGVTALFYLSRDRSYRNLGARIFNAMELIIYLFV